MLDAERDGVQRLIYTFCFYSVPGDEVPIVPGATFKKQKSLQVWLYCSNLLSKLAPSSDASLWVLGTCAVSTYG